MGNLAKDNQKQSISDDQELAKALAGVTEEAEGMRFEESNPMPPLPPAASPAGVAPPLPPTMGMTPPAYDPAAGITLPNMTSPTSLGATDVAVDPNLATVKQAALTELRPLIDKLDVGPEEKFNTYLLLIRSTDDKELIAPAHEAAKAIPDETKKAQALLDIIKEIDFLSSPQKTA